MLLCRNNAIKNTHVITQNWVKHRVWHTDPWPDLTRPKSMPPRDNLCLERFRWYSRRESEAGAKSTIHKRYSHVFSHRQTNRSETHRPSLTEYTTIWQAWRTSSTAQLSVPRHNLSFGSHAFCISAPIIWNSLFLHTLQFQTLSSFRRRWKTHYTFSQPTLPPGAHRQYDTILFWYFGVVQISYLLTYLLTYNLSG